MIKQISIFRGLGFFFLLLLISCSKKEQSTEMKPNVLIAICDDQSFMHHTNESNWDDLIANYPPNFKSIASEGLFFSNAFVASPGCAPSRASILTGRYPWQNKEAGGHATIFPLDVKTLPDVLSESGFHTGYTGKGCDPFNWQITGRQNNPAGKMYNQFLYEKDELPANGISQINYSKNFEGFLDEKKDGEPFYFWFGCYEPHRVYEEGSGLKNGYTYDDAQVPCFLPDVAPVKKDILDYQLEIDWFDKHLGKMIAMLKERGMFDNTIIIVTADNGMPFPAAKANNYEYGIHIPLAICWGNGIKNKKEVVEHLVSLGSITPTVLELLNVEPEGMKEITHPSLAGLLIKNEKVPVPEGVFSARERHSSARWMNLGYPVRSLRTEKFLYIRNYTPERWPAGAPQMLDEKNPANLLPYYGLNEKGEFTGKAFKDIDGSLSLDYLVENNSDEKVIPFFKHAVDKRPQDELYDVIHDPCCMINLALNDAYKDTLKLLSDRLTAKLIETNDPRHTGANPNVFENYQRFYPVRPFPKPDWVSKN